jgi:hypothetical protein
MATRAKRAPSAKPPKRGYSRKPKAPPPPTVESLLTLATEALAAVDVVMAARKDRGGTNWRPYYQNDPLLEPHQAITLVRKELPTLQQCSSSVSDQFLYDHFATAPGEPLTWSRPGAFLAWLGDVPVRVNWGGFLLSDRTTFQALDRRRLFLTESASDGVFMQHIEHRMRDPETFLKIMLAARLNGYESEYRRGKGTVQVPRQMHMLDADGAAAVQNWMADPKHEWWREAIRQTPNPADVIPMPRNIKPVIPKLF